MKGNIPLAWLVAGAVCLSSCGSDGSQYTPPPSSAPDGLSYPDPNMFVQGVAITPLVPTISNGTPTSYWVTPDLPPGLRLESDGKITGTPTAPKAPGTYLVSAGNSTGTSTFGVRITISGRFTIGGTVSGLTGTGLVLTNNGGDDLVIDANGPFVFARALQVAADFSVAIAVQPTGQSCSVAMGSGSLTNDNYGRVAVTCSNTVQKSAWVGTNLTETARALAKDQHRPALATCPVTQLDEPLFEFEIGAADAAPYASSGIPVPAACGFGLVSVDPQGLWITVTNALDNKLLVYANP